jgi:DNA-damage-inducible protein J
LSLLSRKKQNNLLRSQFVLQLIIVQLGDFTMKAATVRARIDENLKIDVEHVLKKLGLSISEAIILFMAQIKLKKGIPFNVKIPNKTTLKTFKDTDADRNLIKHKNAKEMFEKIGN